MKHSHGAIAAALAISGLLGVSGVSAQAPAKSVNQAQAPVKAARPAKSPEAIQDTKGFAEHSGLFRSSAVVGSSVKDLSDKDAGKVEDLLIDSRGRIAYGVVSFGGFLGIGDKLYAVPWDAMMVDRAKRTVYLDVTKETLDRSPSFTADKYPDPNDKEWGRQARQGWSDASITAAVKSKLAGVAPSSLVKVDVDTNQGVVQLSGTVDSERTKQRATEMARNVDGVRRVVNNLKIQG